MLRASRAAELATVLRSVSATVKAESHQEAIELINDADFLHSLALAAREGRRRVQ